MIYFTSDHHFSHERILTYCDRPFSTVTEMDEALIAAWNSTVEVSDIVYHLGDFTLGGQEVAKRYFSRLNGAIKVVPGGHDKKWCKERWRGVVGNYRSKSSVEVEIMMPIHTIKEKGVSITLCHYAMRTWPLSHYNSLHLYGHSHGRLPGTAHSMDVGVDAVEGYGPISVEEVMEKLR